MGPLPFLCLWGFLRFCVEFEFCPVMNGTCADKILETADKSGNFADKFRNTADKCCALPSLGVTN